ncbi:Membrane domain of glycerophosphoryl diester phosphodiesterase [Arthrobacter sp. 9AX]|uniref:hypothetical protein n=1 Tax=Arthrobacter sp. 9AX TaxID=2653131 RepID=UPI0012F0F373|nr:hypothetical protein [Arthrobacter sp. 9AX]VXB56825.1 Membrane domain of glycerophosphoryl diester phosphodiesterase [Arthrobacter sp. 9AX]
MSEQDPGAERPQGPGGQPGWGQQPQWGQPPAPGGPPAWGQQPGWGTPPAWGQPQYSPYGQPRYVAPPKPGIIPLRPLMFGEILDGSFQTIRRNAKAMLGGSLIAQSFAAILAAVITAVTATSMVSIEAWAESATPADLASVGLGFLAAVLLVTVLTLFISAVLQGAMVVPVARSILNRPTGFRQMWLLSRSRAWTLVRLAVLMMLAGLLALLLPAAIVVTVFATMERAGIPVLIPLLPAVMALLLWIYIKLTVAPAAVVIEELGALAALRRSWSLTGANWWRIFGITLVVGIMVGVIGQVVMIPVSLLPTFLSGFLSPHAGSEQEITVAVAVGVATAVVGALVGAVGYAFQTSVMALMYMDLRMRKDGLDIALLRQLESGADPDGIPGRGIAVTRPGPVSGPGQAGVWPDVR